MTEEQCKMAVIVAACVIAFMTHIGPMALRGFAKLLALVCEVREAAVERWEDAWDALYDALVAFIGWDGESDGKVDQC